MNKPAIYWPSKDFEIKGVICNASTHATLSFYFVLSPLEVRPVNAQNCPEDTHVDNNRNYAVPNLFLLPGYPLQQCL